MNYYLTAIGGMPRLLDCAKDVRENFTRKLYHSSFDQLYGQHRPTFEALEQGYLMVIDKDQYLANMAQALVDEAAGRVGSQKKHGQREQMMVDLNLTMVAYVLPMILEYQGESSKPLADKVVAAWKQQFPKTNLQASDRAFIEQGFHRKYCYITTAVCEVLGKPDDCYELRLLRDYRDTYLSGLPEGEDLIRKYYDIAPTIVKHIGQCGEPEAVYGDIWQRYLQPCIRMIERGELHACRQRYEDMVNTLEEQFFFL